ncbi:MAG: Tn3 family transposase [Bacteroidota bacterium]
MLRIKNFKKSLLYSPLARSVYQAQGFHIFPDRLASEELILPQWDDILRLIATIAVRENTASQIFKRLSTYSLQHPLY